MAAKTSFPKDKINVLLLEGIHTLGKDCFNESDYTSVTIEKDALTEDELCERIQDVHVLGIRSKTNVTKKVLDAAQSLLAVGCYCIGTNQVDLVSAEQAGVPVFNAPFSNTRSVAEITIASIIMLARGAFEKSFKLHNGVWNKSAAGSYEVRQKVVGIIGYGHIGPQVGLLAEALGMKVLYFDINRKLPLGNAQQVETLEELLKNSDYVTLHVPETDETKNMIAARQINMMKPGSFLINFSRGTVVDIADLARAIKSEHLLGAAIDVFPYEPKSNSEKFESELVGLHNVILTPHIGGSTIEAQENIAREVSSSLIDFVDVGKTGGSVNFPKLEMSVHTGSHRVLNIHKNVPGVLSEVNRIIADMGANINAQYLGTTNSIGYLVMDVSPNISREVKKAIEALETNIRTRLLF